MRVIIACMVFCLSSALVFGGDPVFVAEPPSAKNLRPYKLTLLGKVINIDLDSPMVQVERFPNGHFQRITVSRSGVVYELEFYPTQERLEEVLSMVKQFKLINGQLILDGPVITYSPEGFELTHYTWVAGKLDGVQTIFNNRQVVVEKRGYAAGYPVGIWSLFYPNGQFAAVIEFPNSIAEWMVTEVKGSESKASEKKRDPHRKLDAIPYHHPVATSAKWYDERGHKQKEIFYRVYKQDESFVIEPTGESLSYNAEGDIVRTVNKPHGTGLESRNKISLGNLYKTDILWFNDSVFKVVENRFPVTSPLDSSSK